MTEEDEFDFEFPEVEPEPGKRTYNPSTIQKVIVYATVTVVATVLIAAVLSVDFTGTDSVLKTLYTGVLQ